MYKEPIFLKPFFQERVWGGDKLKELFRYNIPTSSTGEAWVISGHENGQSIVMNGSLEGMNLADVWKAYPYLFGNADSKKEFPLLIKILDANDRLSVQVHPDDEYASQLKGAPTGKSECWYVLECDEGAEVIIGHKAQSRSEFEELVNNQKWMDLFHVMKVKKGDFIYVPSGTLHAIGEGIVILETQQSSDITFRVYDYDRCDGKGGKRELHLEDAFAVINCPHQELVREAMKVHWRGMVSTRLIEDKNFAVYHWQLNGRINTPIEVDFLLASVINGEGKVGTEGALVNIRKGDNFILPATVVNYFLEGDLEMIVSHI
ncbi:mannose-6-phosphate isomerase, class I [Planococcus shenhongbingii]|uniref:mannose-6-phosphate isomerase, class I n=1 Tax=Planococcus shenhongbingii TaxID=3058398 RepID=UPI00261CF300|nr:mannose-6-phosphate isomerase, class I [Planococcus sp. N016]WKA57747.1 mannose-6-phosphate isomerase, class I [Planococcus sp. N016]